MKWLDRVLLIGVVVLLLATLAWPAARHMLVLQVRLAFGVAPAHPHFVSPWLRPGGCIMYAEPRMEVTRDDYEWLVDRYPDDWRVHIAGAAGTPRPGSEESREDSPQARKADQNFRERLARRATQLSPDTAVAQAVLLTVRLRRWPPISYLKPQEGVQEATTAQTLPRPELDGVLELIATGEREDPGNAYWPVMRMAANAAAGDFGGARAALRDACNAATFRDFDGDIERMVADAWAAEGIPATAALNYAGRRLSTLGCVPAAIELMAARTAFLERRGETQQADAIYHDLLDVAALVAGGPTRPMVVSLVLTTRPHIIRDGKLDDSLPREERIGRDDALKQFVEASRGRGRADLARHAVACARIEERAAAERKARFDESDSAWRLAVLGQMAWWPQVFLIPFAALLCVGGICGRRVGARWDRLRAARRGALLALLVLVALYGTGVLVWGLRPPEYGFGPGPSRSEVIAERVAGSIAWLLPVVFAVLAWRLGWKAPAHAVAQAIRRVGVGCIRLGVAALIFVLALGLCHAWICQNAAAFALGR